MAEVCGIKSESMVLLESFLGASNHDIMVSTANKEGAVNVTVYGSPRVIKQNTIQFEIVSKSVTYSNIQENRSIVFMVVRPGNSISEYGGVRIYAQVDTIYTEGEEFDFVKEKLCMAGEHQKAAALVATVTCAIYKIRPVVDNGQPWESSL